ncbi:MAG TPA: substrate-binding domain-containing protein [Tepidisphaeraceae bacterium]|nr:substrate-binding domain-containing protein [Tepidisphaeraceae bacterium]
MPAVNISSASQHLMPSVVPDNVAIGRLAAEDLLSRGFRHLGVFGGLGHEFAQQRLSGFHSRISDAGLACATFDSGNLRPTKAGRRGLEGWLAALPKPAAILSLADDDSIRLLSACRDAGVMVPEQVAVLSVDNEEFMCNFAIPPLSSIDTDLRRVGYEGAAMLDRLMRGRPAPQGPLRIAPIGIVTRRSSDITVIGDAEVLSAIRFIRERACEPVGVKHVLRAVQMSRSGLDRRFKAALGRTVNDEILRVRLDRVRELLTGTDWPMSRIADATGFPNGNYLAAVFRRETGATPTAFRRARRKS